MHVLVLSSYRQWCDTTDPHPGLKQWGDDVVRIAPLKGGVANDVWTVRVNGHRAVARRGVRSDADLAWETALLLVVGEWIVDEWQNRAWDFPTVARTLQGTARPLAVAALATDNQELLPIDFYLGHALPALRTPGAGRAGPVADPHRDLRAAVRRGPGAGL